MKHLSIARVTGAVLLLGSMASVAQSTSIATSSTPAKPTATQVANAAQPGGQGYDSGVYATGAMVQGNNGGIYNNGAPAPTPPAMQPANPSGSTPAPPAGTVALPRRRR